MVLAPVGLPCPLGTVLPALGKPCPVAAWPPADPQGPLPRPREPGCHVGPADQRRSWLTQHPPGARSWHSLRHLGWPWAPSSEGARERGRTLTPRGSQGTLRRTRPWARGRQGAGPSPLFPAPSRPQPGHLSGGRPSFVPLLGTPSPPSRLGLSALPSTQPSCTSPWAAWSGRGLSPGLLT